MSEIAVIGAGAWGTGLSIVLGRKGSHRVRLWAHEKEVCESIRERRVNQMFLAARTIPNSVTPSNDLATALDGAQIVVSVMPSQHCRPLFEKIRPLLRPGTIIVSANPTAVSVASADDELASTIQREFSDPSFRVYTNPDVIGVELGGALKNIIAIAAGISDGLGLGHNSVAALITRGLAEMTRLVVACGGHAETMAGLAGLGDLVLTCTGGLSRNRSVGVELGRGKKLPDIVAAMHGMVAEGIFTTTAAVGLARARNVEMPITEQMHAILHQGKAPRDAIFELMTRSGKSENSALGS